jgi:hypothetical protein
MGALQTLFYLALIAAIILGFAFREFIPPPLWGRVRVGGLGRL